MNAIYETTKGKKIEIDLRRDILLGHPFPNKVSGYVIYEDGTKNIIPDFEEILLKDKTGKLFFLFEDEKIYVSDFKSMSINELADKIENKEEISNDEIIATLIKHSDDIAFVTALVYHTCIGVENEVTCIPELDKEGKIDWEIGITLIPEDLSSIALYRSVYVIYQELIDKIRTGEIKVVCRDTRKKMKNPQKVMINGTN